MKHITMTLVAVATVTAAGCGSESGMMTGSGNGPGTLPRLMSVSPAGGAMGVPLGSPLELHWSTPMGTGMEQFVDLHMGDLSGPAVPMSCAWSGNQTTLTCTPASPLQSGTQYTVHLGGGMVDATGQYVEMEMYGPGFGGQWVQSGMMGVGHAGTAWGMMGGGWRHSNGSYGMAFTFTTA